MICCGPCPAESPEPAEVAVSQLITVPDLTVVSPMHIRRDLHDRAVAAAESNR